VAPRHSAERPTAAARAFAGERTGAGRPPHYEADRVGPTRRWDERDVLFARADLFRVFPEGSPERERYYSAHPERREFDRTIASMPRIGSGGGDYRELCDALFDVVADVAREDAVDGGPSGERAVLSPHEAARRVKERARALGADLVGTGPLRQEWVYSNVGRTHGNAEGFAPWGARIDLSAHTDAVAMGFRMEPDLVRAAPEFPTVFATGAAYAIGAYAAVALARFIRGLGYSARAHHLHNYRVLAVPVAVDCGLGELSRAGFLMTREFGLGLRLGVVTTDLPLAHDEPCDIGVQSFCDVCEICAEHCPSGAIPRGPKREYNGVRKWKLDEERCYRYWYAVSTDCAVCMSTCPWTKPDTWIHRGLTRLAMRRGPHQRVMVAAEKVFYGAPDKRDRGRTVGFDSLRPTRTRIHMRVMSAVVAVLAAVGVLWRAVGRTAAGADLTQAVTAGRLEWLAYVAWLAWTLLGVAAVWTFLAERTLRPALVALVIFGAVSALLALAAFRIAA